MALEAFKDLNNFFRELKSRIITISEYTIIMKLIPEGIAYRLRLYPGEGLGGRLNHLYHCLNYCFSSIYEVAHIEGYGAKGKCFDANVDGFEIDFTVDRELTAEKKAAMIDAGFNKCRVILIPYTLTAQVDANDAFKPFIIKDKLSMRNLLEPILMEAIQSLELKQTHTRFTTTLSDTSAAGVKEWCCNYVDLVTPYVDSVNFNLRSFRHPSASLGDFDHPLVRVFKLYSTTIQPARFINDDFSLGDYVEDKTIFNKPFFPVQGFGAIANVIRKGKVCSNVFKLLLGTTNHEYVDTHNRVRARNSQDHEQAFHIRAATSLTYAEIIDKAELEILDLSQAMESDISKLLDSVSNVVSPTVKDVIEETLTALSKLKAYNVVSHRAEVAMSVMVSQKMSSRNNYYHFGKNGPYASYTISQITNNNDKYENASYFTISKSDNPILGHDIIHITPFRTYARDKLVWDVKLPYVCFMLAILQFELNEDTDSRTLTELFSSAMINRDTFSQVSENFRYLMMTALSKKLTYSEIFEKKIRPILSIRTPYEFVYLVRMCMITHITAAESLIGNYKNTYFVPTLSKPVKSFEALVNHFYICNLFNKFRTFKLNSSALNYQQLLDERNIYLESAEGLQPDIDMLMVSEEEYKQSIITNRDNILDYVKLKLSLGPKRFSFCHVFLVYALCLNPSTHIHGNIHSKSLSKTPLEACTMRGGMEPGIKAESQANRAAGVIIDGIKSSYMEDNIQNINCLSIYNLQCVNMADKDIYRYRITPKDQKGHREISVLNYQYRLGALFVEELYKSLAKDYSDDYLMDEYKQKKFYDVINIKEADTVYDNNDQSRWGPNSIMECFAFMTSNIIIDDDIVAIVNSVLMKVKQKRAKVPEDVIKFSKTGRKSLKGCTLDNLLQAVGSEIEFDMPFGMGQGILHQTSSIYHTIMNTAMVELLHKTDLAVCKKSMITSDDCFRLFVDVKNYISLEDFISKVMGLANIIRSPTKSSLSSVVAEFNSAFYMKGRLAIPSIKKCTSLIDCGAGLSIIPDMLSAASSGANLLADGSSLLLSDSLAVCNLTLVKEQWNLFGARFGKDVFNLSDPKICSIVALICGNIGVSAIGSFREDVELVNIWGVAVSNCVSKVSLNETVRSSRELTNNVVYLEKDLTGVVNLFNYPKAYIPFIRRYKFEVNDVSPDFTNRCTDGKHFYFNLARNFMNRKWLMVNHDFFKRLTEPKRSFGSKSYVVDGIKMDKLEMLSHITNKEYNIRENLTTEISDIIQQAIIRSREILTAVSVATKDRDAGSMLIKPARVVIDKIVDIPMKDLKLKLYNSIAGSNLEKLMFAEDMVNTLFTIAPSRLKLLVPKITGSSLNSIVKSLIRYKTVPYEKMSLEFDIDVYTTTRSITMEGKAIADSINIVREAALNCYKRDKTYIKGLQTAVTTLTLDDINKEALTSSYFAGLFMSASGANVASISKDLMVYLSQNGHIPDILFKFDNALGKIFFDTKIDEPGLCVYFRLQHFIKDSYSHYIFVNKKPIVGKIQSDNKFIDGKTNRTCRDPIAYVVLEDSGPVFILEDFPVIAAKYGGVVVPLMWVEPKHVGALEEIQSSTRDYKKDSVWADKTADEEMVAIVDDIMQGSTYDKDLIYTILTTPLKFDDKIKKEALAFMTTNSIFPKLESVDIREKSVIIDSDGEIDYGFELDPITGRVIDDEGSLDSSDESAQAGPSDIINNFLSGVMSLEAVATSDYFSKKNYRYESSPIRVAINTVKNTKGRKDLSAVWKLIMDKFNDVSCAVIKVLA